MSLQALLGYIICKNNKYTFHTCLLPFHLRIYKQGNHGNAQTKYQTFSPFHCYIIRQKFLTNSNLWAGLVSAEPNDADFITYFSPFLILILFNGNYTKLTNNKMLLTRWGWVTSKSNGKIKRNHPASSLESTLCGFCLTAKTSQINFQRKAAFQSIRVWN